MKKKTKENLQNTFERWLKEHKIKNKEKQEYQKRISQEMEEEKRNLSRKGKFRKIFIWTGVVIAYDIFRMVLRYYSERNLFEISDLVFSAIVIGIYSYYIFNYSKLKDENESKK
ncbi:hypothetical protein [Anaerosphaera multitolerans]|uniref:Uncharacterized protein n=1 Tax=Anaerosphaera multitolerans TaxID=2487351 RepID=A0A437S485_9FIRM|nr:hypothetical protein [Anaerosphaera multitolerans]RVU53823.1 hypothetical protein EF514_10560 [Anaerosphaera multitolerans]